MSTVSLRDPLASMSSPTATAPTTPAKAANAAAARKTANEFESYFLSQFVDRMFQGIPKDSLTGNGHGEDIFRSMLSQEYGKALAGRGGAGIADQVYREIMKTQEIH
ncbi:MAG TPA: rod-binding protein [Alphaproteobacteria bacterium]|jgi:Rod binding domain-containing protein|nr:rod-binding protein [Alphaproteobacteria bacterium]